MFPWRVVSGIGAIVALVVGIALVSTDNQVFDWIYRSQLALSPISASFPMWQNIPPLYARIYLFNVTNADEVTNNGAKPNVSEVGPYVFYERHHKTKLQWNQNNTITYKQIRTWTYAEDVEGNGDLNDVVTIINPIAASVAEMLRTTIPKFWHPGMNGILLMEKEQVFVTHTAKQIIFDGFDDPMLKMMEDAEFILKQFVPPGAFMDKFAFFYARNGTDYTDGVFNMDTGVENPQNMGQVYSWNYTTHDFFPGSCGDVRGGAGEFYPPQLNQTFIEMYSNDLCRSLRFNFNNLSYPHGIRTHEYVADRSLFANGTENPDNKCYNPPSVNLPSGVFNTSVCRFGAPVFVSQPHFLLSDPYYASMVDGLSPDPEKHRTFLRIEPESGVPVEVTARFQMNVLLDKVSDITMFKNVPRCFVPVMWFENAADVPENMVFEMKLLANLKTILGGMGWTIFGLGISTLLILAIRFATRRKAREDTGPILSESLVDDSDSENVFHD